MTKLDLDWEAMESATKSLDVITNGMISQYINWLEQFTPQDLTFKYNPTLTVDTRLHLIPAIHQCSNQTNS